MTQEETAIQLLQNYAADIRWVLQQFRQQGNMANPVKACRSGRLARIGFLDAEEKVKYFIHGAGCSVEFPTERIVSFDLDERDHYLFDPWKFKLYAETPGVERMTDLQLRRLAEEHFYHP